MDNLRDSITSIFGLCSSDDILYDYFNNHTKSIVENFEDDLFIKLCVIAKTNYSLNEIQNIKQKLNEDWFIDLYQKSKSQKSIFNLLTHFNKQVLTEREKEPFVNYEHLLKWREISFSLGEDLFTTSYLAYMDVRSSRKRSFFAWKPVIFSNNDRLKGILSQGMAENHFHLKGSAPVFDLSWLCLMNNVYGHEKTFEKLKKEIKLKGSISSSFNNNYEDIEVSVYKAIYIRKFLFEKINNINNQKISNSIKHTSNKEKSAEFLSTLNKLNIEINTLKKLNGYAFSYKEDKVVADYAISKKIHQENFKGSVLLVGERELLYECFRKIYSQDPEFRKIQDLFFTYLLIKNRFREELIQVNKKVGFGNFQKYQDRKEYFIPQSTIYESAFITMAINDSLAFQKISSFESRITPKDNANKLNSTIVKLHNEIRQNSIAPTFKNQLIENFLGLNITPEKIKSTKLFHTLHFIKEPDRNLIDKSKDIFSLIIPRHSELRKKVQKQSKAIVELREGYSRSSELIRGIDAASSEFDTRPEVFAQAFRFLKDHKLKGFYNNLKETINENKLYATFHAGEDFYDLVDGLRTIDEAINYLNLKQGDRLGHALALGINTKDYYDFKERKLMLPKEILLDNIVWLLAKIRKFGISICRPEVNRLEKFYDSLFREIYQDNFEGSMKNEYYPHTLFFDSWKLRGDDPFLYLNNYDNIDVELIPNVTYWERCRINYFYPKNSNIRQSKLIKFLYHEYHFNPKVKRSGKKIKQFIITQDYISLVSEVQECYRNAIKKLNIGIECNPTSNYLIGTFDNYAKHPILTFYNLGLEIEPKKIKDCPQLFVSINTDDQGIFGTSLENEYALMAIALEKEKDEFGQPKYHPTMIYQWLDNIRKMGLEQSFNKD
jgi:hypothetical protein